MEDPTAGPGDVWVFTDGSFTPSTSVSNSRLGWACLFIHPASRQAHCAWGGVLRTLDASEGESFEGSQPILLNVPPFWRPGLLPYHHSGRCSCIIACPIARLRFLQPMVKCRHPWKVSRPQWPPSMPCVGSSSRDATLTPMSQVTLELPRTRLLTSCPSLLPLKTCGPVGCSRLIACSLFGVTRTLPDWHGSPPSCGAAPETPAFLHYKEPPWDMTTTMPDLSLPNFGTVCSSSGAFTGTTAGRQCWRSHPSSITPAHPHFQCPLAFG